MKLFSLLSFISVLALIGCSSNTTNDTSTSAFSGTVDIGAGRKMYLECVGTGSPTVILISGLANRADIWHESDQPQEPSVFAETSTFTRVCAYDRPGTATYSEQQGVMQSRSDPIPQPTTTTLAAKDLQ